MKPIRHNLPFNPTGYYNAYSLLIHPFFLTPLSLHEPGMQNLEMYWWSSKGSKSQIPRTHKDVDQRAQEGFCIPAVVMSRSPVAAPFLPQQVEG